MIPEKKRKTAKELSLAVIIAGVLVITGWIFDISVSKSVSPAWVTTKLTTAIAFHTAILFVLSGMGLLCL